MKTVINVGRGDPGHWVGDGFPVRTVLSYHDGADAFSPFLLLDHAGPRDFEPTSGRRGVEWHPHRGFETVTVVYDGAVEHEDSAGHSGRIGPGDVQWMTAGAGVLHQELHAADFAAAGGRFEMLQLWVNLPAAHKLTRPRYQTLTRGDIPVVELAASAGQVRVIAGSFGGVAGPARTFSPVELLDVRVTGGRSATLPLRDGWTSVLQVVRGDVTVNGTAATAGDRVLLSRRGADVTLAAATDASVFVMHGEPIDEPVVGYGPFVMNTADEIRSAITDYREGRLGTEPAAAG